MTSRVYLRIVASLALAAGALGATRPAFADEHEPQLPSTLSLADAIALFRAHGLDLLIAEAAVDSADGDVTIADAIPNPAVSVGFGRSRYFQCNGTATQCQSPPNLYNVSISDQAAIEDTLSGKRRLRGDVAKAALRAARLSRNDADRTLVLQVKTLFEQMLTAQVAVATASQTEQLNAQLLAKADEQSTSGKIGGADVLRYRTAKLESDQSVDQAKLALRKARVQLALLLGVRSAVPEFSVREPELEAYALPAKLGATTHDALLQRAFEARPDLQAQQAQLQSAQAQLALNRRERFPDITLSVGYTQQGVDPDATTPPTLSVSLSAPIPILYQQQGEIRKAEAAVHTQELQVQKLRAQIVSDFEGAYADYVGSQALVERMEHGQLLQTALDSQNAVLKAKELGAATPLEVLTAIATYIETKVEYQNEIASYWTAVFELEQATGMELR